MTSTRNGPRELAEAVGAKARELAGKIRRFVVTRTTSALWQVTGHDLASIGGEVETREAEVFQGIGFYARPDDDEDTEAIVAFVAGAGNPIAIAVRNEATRRQIAADLLAGETQIHNATVLIRIKANGTVEIRTAAGVAVPLATKADLEALRTYVRSNMTIACPAGTSTPGTSDVTGPPAVAGTQVLKAQ